MAEMQFRKGWNRLLMYVAPFLALILPLPLYAMGTEV